MKAIALGELADCAGARLRGDAKCMISGLASIEKAKSSELSFLTNKLYRKYLDNTAAGAVLLGKEDENESYSGNVLISDNPKLALAKIARLFEKQRSGKAAPGIHPTAIVGEGCRIAPTASIGPYVVIGNQVQIDEGAMIGSGCSIGDFSMIGAHTCLKPRVTIYDRVQMGKNCLIHSGVVIGADGFGYANEKDGSWVKMPDLGGVKLGNSVEIGANTTVDRGFLEDTHIGNGVIIDNLVQVGHNVSIGDYTAIAACVAIAGSTTIGKYCLIGGAVCIAGHLELGDKVYLTAMSGVNHSINVSGVYSSGLPAKPNHVWRKNAARFQYLDEMAKRLRAVEKLVGENLGDTKQCLKSESEVG